ncbi:anaphase-promoting complex, cyclosome, subunit 4-domain-containing protein [Amylocarpus encephaloides]|uniref:Anaphase-promoting complex subunit 4 n=1 Tax=Amylocarpus encephaloides TaxID=45428 RepID=A0A9P7YH70_9HELO|nr:anaphase-promoting complex, cyclosome, subunit 4-domain-containing protein [Amylocarpus encephaloides]
MAPADALELLTLGEKALPQPVDPKLVTHCPSVDLIALGTTDQQVLIYRLNGQRVYGAAQKAERLKIESIKWKPNGQMLAVAWSDGSVHLIGSESAKIVHQFSTGEAVSGITCMGWGSNATNKSSSSTKRNASWEEVLNSSGLQDDEKFSLDLPRDLSMIDIEISLPKLSLLAAGGSSDDVFCSRSSLDALFRPFDPKDNDSVDVMVVGTKEGEVHLTVYDSFIVGSFQLPRITSGALSRLIRHSSTNHCSTHSLLLRSSDPSALYLSFLDLRFISATSEYLSLLASRSTALQNLLRYINQVQSLMTSEWKSTQELPAKFLRSVSGDLKDKHECNIVQALYHSVVTGHNFPVVKEWLVDELSERGLKRWEKAVVTGLEGIRRLVHENMVPALDRCSVILSRLSGIAKFKGPNSSVGFSSQQISLITDTVACLHLVANKILMQAMDELDLFAAFSSWLRFQIDTLASDSSTPNDEEIEKESLIDHSKVLLYIEDCMTASPLEVYFGDSTPEELELGNVLAGQDVSMFDELDEQLQKEAQGLPYKKSLPRLEVLCKTLSWQSNAVFGQIAEAEKRNVRFGNPQHVGFCGQDGLIDMRMVELTSSVVLSYVLFARNDIPSSIQVTRTTFSVENGLSSVGDVDSSVVALGDGHIKDLKVINDITLLVLWSVKESSYILSIPYDGPPDGPKHPGAYYMDYFPHLQNSPTPITKSFSNAEVINHFHRYAIPNTGPFTAERLEVRVNAGNESNSSRVVVSGKDRQHYKVLAFPTSVRKDLINDVGIESDEEMTMSGGS